MKNDQIEINYNLADKVTVTSYNGTQGRIGNEKVICHVMGLGAPYRKFQSQLQ